MDEQIQTFTPEDIEQNKVIAALAYLIFFLPLLAAKDSAYGRFHANQSLLLLITSFVINVVVNIVSSTLLVATFAWGLYSIIATLLMIVNIAIFAVYVIWAVNAYNGKANPLPVIGGIKIIK